jgi:hypothetical protein
MIEFNQDSASDSAGFGTKILWIRLSEPTLLIRKKTIKYSVPLTVAQSVCVVS